MTQRLNILSGESESKPGKLVNVSEEQEVQIFAKQMLAKRIFIGHYQERRYVQPVQSYRDVISVSDTEDDLPRDLNIVKKRLEQFYPSHVWTGITGPDMPGAPVGVCVWVQLNNIPFGHYWFQIREVKFFENLEICLRLKCLRSVNLDGGSVSPTVSRTELSGPPASPEDETLAKQDVDEVSPAFEFQKIISDIKNIDYTKVIMSWVPLLSVLFTLDNLRKVISFFVILVVAIATGFVKFLEYLGEFTLKAIREISILIQSCTPLFLGIIDFFSKCVGGILILITLMWRGSVPNNTFQQQPYMPPRPLALPAGPNRPPRQMYKKNW